jgi:hypothetical protein
VPPPTAPAGAAVALTPVTPIAFPSPVGTRLIVIACEAGASIATIAQVIVALRRVFTKSI